MFDDFTIFLILIVILAALIRDDLLFTVVYLFAGAFLLGRWWSRRALRGVHFNRSMTTHAFMGEEVPVRLEIHNTSLLPVVWMTVQDLLPVELVRSRTQNQTNVVLSLGPKEKTALDYTLLTRKRGCYQVGPLVASSGDLLGLGGEDRSETSADVLTVYPKIIQFAHFSLPSFSPMGNLRHNQPLFEDPTRVLSKRDYVAGDSLRRVDWKATAILGRLQVKQFEPSIALETALILNLNPEEYDWQSRFDATELAIVTAASIANWVISKKQSVGLITNGVDPLSENRIFSPLPPRKGKAHLIRLLEILARVQTSEDLPFLELIRLHYLNCSWGTTLVLLTGKVDDELLDGLFPLRQAGLNLVLIQLGQAAQVKQTKEKANYFHIPYYNIRNELDLDFWRK